MHAAAFDAAHVPLFCVDRHGQIVLWNRRMEAVSTYTHADVVGSPLWRAEPFATGETAALVRSSLERAFAGDGVIGFSLNMRTRRGRGVTLKLNASPLPDGGIVLTGDPVGDQRDATRPQQHASSVAESARPARPHGSPRIDLASLSHELRTPLNGLLGSLELALQQQPVATGMQTSLRHAVASGTQLLDLVNDLLALQGTVELERQRFNLHEVLSTHAEECAVSSQGEFAMHVLRAAVTVGEKAGRALVRPFHRAAELTGDERLVSDASGAPYFGRASARPRSSRTSASGMKLSPAFPPSSLPTLSGARPRSSRTSGPRR